MKKLALAAALTAAFAGTAYAQSSVTVYGRVNTTVEYQDNNANVGEDTVTGMRNNASRFGLMGKEDLGGGLNAFFQLEAGFDSGTGQGGDNLFGREANVGLTSKELGQIKIGRIGITSLYGYTIDWIGVFNHDTGTTAEDNIYVLPVTLSNAIEYTSPTFFGGLFGGFTVNANENTDSQVYQGFLVYQKGDLHLAGGYSKQNEQGFDQTGWVGTVAYTFGPVLLGLEYDYVDQKTTGANFGTRNSVTGTAQYTLGASEFHLSVGWADAWSRFSSSDALQFTLGYNYNLSKRTKLYGFYYQIDNNNGLASQVPSGDPTPAGPVAYGSSGLGLLAQSNKTLSSIGVGIRHNF